MTDRHPTASNGVRAIGRADIRVALAGWDADACFALSRRWTARYLPIWSEAYPRYAAAAGIAEEKRALQSQRMTEFLERMDAVYAGEPVVKARLTETDSAISALSSLALHHFAGRPWTNRIRPAALAARYHMHIAQEGGNRERIPASVYHWAEIETGFPGDSRALLQLLTTAERASCGPGFDDGHHLLFGRPAREAGLEAEGRAVYDAVAGIMARIAEDPGSYPVGDAFWGDEGPERFSAQRTEGYFRFHGQNPPRWLR